MVGNHPYSALNEVCVLGRASEIPIKGKFREATGRRVISVSVGLNFLVRAVKLTSPSLLEIKKSNFRNSSQILPKSLPKENQWRNLFGNFNNRIFQEEKILYPPFRQFVLGKNHGILRVPPPNAFSPTPKK